VETAMSRKPTADKTEEENRFNIGIQPLVGTPA
jgi:hypothetical protein